MNYFNTVNEFYEKFYKIFEKDLKKFFYIHNNQIKKKKKNFPHYSIEDIKFRLIRDSFLKKDEYKKIMFLMFEEKNFDYFDISKKLFFQKNDLRNLDNLGHLVGLH